AGGLVTARLAEVLGGLLEDPLDLGGGEVRVHRAEQRGDAGDVRRGEGGAGDRHDLRGALTLRPPRGGEDLGLRGAVGAGATGGRQVDVGVEGREVRRLGVRADRADGDDAVAGRRRLGGRGAGVAGGGDDHGPGRERLVDGGLHRGRARGGRAAERQV